MTSSAVALRLSLYVQRFLCEPQEYFEKFVLSEATALLATVISTSYTEMVAIPVSMCNLRVTATVFRIFPRRGHVFIGNPA
jgi:hypothetical protein